uniref:UPF0587 protein (inferred by orthology to a C. elegans protein) n=1 Tax=Anisakis simplex TaxID=6269 RepID=A0A0M3JMT1_ANISI
LIAKCKLCGRVNSLVSVSVNWEQSGFSITRRCIYVFLSDIVKDSYKPYSIDDSEQYHPIVKFDCRGVEPTAFDPRVGWKAVGTESGTPFDDIDLSEK